MSSRHERRRLLKAAQEASPMKPGSEDRSWMGFSGWRSKRGLKRLLSSFERDGGESSWTLLNGVGSGV